MDPDQLASALKQDPNNLPDINDMPNGQGGYFMTSLINALKSGLTLPGDVATGKVDPMSDEGIARAQDMAGLAMTGGLGGAGEGAGATLGSGPIRAYHGSPHDFDAFDLSKIGTGEGAQAYGHGLYFAENEGVAKSYRDALSSSQTVSTVTPRGQALYAMDNFGDGAAKWLAQQASQRKGSPLEARYSEALDLVKSGAVKPGGRMYEVGIHADPQTFLDWDKPIGANDPARSLLGDAARAAYDQADYGAGRNAAKDALLASRSENLTGQGAYNSLVRSLADAPAFIPGGEGYFKPAAANASALLDQAGIPGIKYLDQGSRGAGDGSRNLVVFNPAIVEIMRKYGVASMAALPPAVLAALQNGQTPPDPQS